MPIDASTIFFYLTAFAFLGILHVFVMVILGPRRRFGPSPEGPRCQVCGYIRFGDAGELCPECGHDSTIDRLNDIPPRRPIPPISLTVAAALLLLPLSILAGYPIAARFNQSWQSRGEQLLSTSAGNVGIWVDTQGLGAAREIRWAMVRILDQPHQRSLVADMDAMTLKSLGKAYKGSLPIVIRRDTVAHLLDNNDQHPPQVLQAADEIVASLQSLHDHQWPEDRFVTEMAGHYLLDPDDDAGPFFWLPNYALACLPLWAILTIFAARYFIRRYRAAMLTYDQQRGEAIKSLRAAR